MAQIIITVDGRTYDFEPSSDLDRLLDAIARRRLGVATGLRTRDSDRVDFYDCHVGQLRTALADAVGARAAEDQLGLIGHQQGVTREFAGIEGLRGRAAEREGTRRGPRG